MGREVGEVAPGIRLEWDQWTEEDLDTGIGNLTVMKLKKAGKYSIRSRTKESSFQHSGKEGNYGKHYDKCSSMHERGSIRAACEFWVTSSLLENK